MSCEASPTRSTAPQTQVDTRHTEPETFDLLEDVSHHGASLFEFLPIATPSLGSFASPRHDNVLQSRTMDPLHNLNPTIGSASAAHAQPVTSYCTIDPPEFSHIQMHPSSSHLALAVSPTLPTSSTQQTNRTQPNPSRNNSKSVKNIRQLKKPPTRSPNSNSRNSPKSTSSKMLPSKAIAKPHAATSPNSTTARRKRPLSKNSFALSDMDNESYASEAATVATSRPSTSQQPELSSPAIEVVSKDTHNSHTRRCRAKVNSKFQELLGILPTPPPKTGIKHKAQILDYTIRVFRDIHARKTQLEADLALSSRAQLNTWIETVLSRSLTLYDTLAPYLKLICTKGRWKYSEAWVPTQEVVSEGLPAGMDGMTEVSSAVHATAISPGPNTKLRIGQAVIPSLGNTDDPDLQAKLERFRDKSRPYGFKARVDLPGRIMCTMRPEWLPSLEDQDAFRRARLAKDASLVVCFGVPIFVRGHVAAVAVFFDTEQRAYDAKCVDLADNVARLLGNSIGAFAARNKPLR